MAKNKNKDKNKQLDTSIQPEDITPETGGEYTAPGAETEAPAEEAPMSNADMRAEIKAWQNSQDGRFNNTGVQKALNNKNIQKAYERMMAAQSNYDAINATGNEDLLNSAQEAYSSTKKKNNAGDKVNNMYTAWAGANNYDTETGTYNEAPAEETEPESEIPDDVNQDVTKATQDTAADILAKANEYLNNAKGFYESSQGYMDSAINPNTADFDANVEAEYAKRLGLLDSAWNIDDINNPGYEAEPYVDALVGGTETIFNRGLEDSSTRAGFNTELAQDYNNARTRAMMENFDMSRNEKLGERYNLRDTNSSFANLQANQGNSMNNFAGNLIGQGMSGLNSAAQQNLNNLTFVRDTIENNYITEQNARIKFYELLQDDRFAKPLKRYLAENPELLFQTQSSGGDFWSSLLQGGLAAIGGAFGGPAGAAAGGAIGGAVA